MTKDNISVRTRMAPSPTGEMHVGSFSVILKNYAFAKKHGGQFILRIEDTDKEREVPGAIDRIIETIKDYGLDFDEGPGKGGQYGPYIQSERLDIYKKMAQQLVDDGKAYYCFCSKERLTEIREKARAEKRPPKYDRHCLHLSREEMEKKLADGQPYVIRLKVPENKDISFVDGLRGEIVISSNEIDDQVLLKSDGYPTYHLAVVIDDHLMKISHVMRGEEWLPSTPKHILLYQAFGWQHPDYTHIPVYLNPDGKGKMSKRKGDVSAQSFLEKGYLPEAMLNFFMILGWASESQEEIMTLDQYIDQFDPKDISMKSVAFDINKLDWMNGVYIRRLSLDELKLRLKSFIPDDFPTEKIDQILPLVQERLVVLSDLEELTDFFYRDINVDQDLLLKKADRDLVAKQLEMTSQSLANITEWSVGNIETVIRSLQEENQWKRGQYFMMIRIAVTGKKATPPLFETIEVMGKELVLERLKTVLN